MSAESAKEFKKKKPTRFALDYSARFYPVIASRKAQSIFCVGAELNDEIDKSLLCDAVNDVIPRFPSLKVRIRKGYGWHYLENNDERVKVFDIDGRMLRPIDPHETNGYWFRLACRGRRVQVDMFHALTDGNGAIAFLKSVLMRYRELQGVVFDDKTGIIDWQETPDEQETEDSFEKYYKPVALKDIDLKSIAGGVPHRMKGTPVDNGYLSILGSADAVAILKNAKALDASFTSYIVGMLAYTIEQVSGGSKPIVMMIPVNLRSIFPSKTMRNFVTFVRVIIRPSTLKTPEEFVKEAQRQLSEKAHKNKMEEFISTTVRAQGSLILRCVPLFLKIFFVKLGRLFMRSRQTIIYSNLGRHSVPDGLGVKRFIFNMNVSKNNPQNVGSVTVGDEAVFAFTKAIKENDLNDAFFDNLRSCGVAVEVAKTE